MRVGVCDFGPGEEDPVPATPGEGLVWIGRIDGDQAPHLAALALLLFLAERAGGLPELAPRGVRQAERAIDLGLRLGRAGQPVRYDELGIFDGVCP